MQSPVHTDFLIQALPLLLHDHDCLVVPDFGGFVAHPVPARYDGDKGEWVPPGRNVAFNPKLTVRDGLLEQEIRRATGCSNEAAGALIDREVAALKQAVQSGHTQDIPGLGRLYLNEQGRIAFAPEARIGERYAPPGLGRIPWLDRTATQAEETPEVEAPRTVPEPAEPATASAIRRDFTPLLRVAAVLLPVLLVGSFWWRSNDAATFDLFPSDSGPSSHYLPRIEGEDIRFPEEPHAALSFIDPKAPDLQPVASTEEMMPIPEPAGTASGCTHHVIAGTFSTMNRAATLARRFESLGYSTSILPGPSGNHRVSAGCFMDAAKASTFRKGLQQHHGIEQAWILKD